jgi:hypothetical protein
MPLQLPEELLDRIIYYVAAWHPSYSSWISQRHRETLLSICLASKTLCRLARPHLYKAFSNHAEKRDYYWTDVGAGTSDAKYSSTPPLLHDVCARYLRTLCVKPEYGAMAASISLSMTDHKLSSVPQQVSREEHADLRLFQQRAQAFWFGVPDTDRFQECLYQALLERTPDATACMILLACPNIETLEIMGSFGARAQPSAGLLAHLLEIGTAHTLEPAPSNKILGTSSPEFEAGTRLPGLKKSLILQHVQNLELGMFELDLTLPQTKAIFSLPSLRVLRINTLTAIDGVSFNVRGMTLDWPHCAQLKELFLGLCLVPGSTVAELLRLCPNLTKFEAIWASDIDCNPAFKEIGTAISKHTPLLTSLKLRDDSYGDYEIPQSTRLRYSLQGLQHLTHMELNGDSLWRHPEQHVDTINDNLPSSIETLDVSEYPFSRGPPFVGEDAASFDAPCTAGFSNKEGCTCRIKDIRRLLLDERLRRLRRVTFTQISTASNEKEHDPQVLRHICTAAVRRRGWKMSERVVERPSTYSPDIIHSYHETVLYREWTDE